MMQILEYLGATVFACGLVWALLRGMSRTEEVQDVKQEMEEE